jgi:hypothetical protein
MTSGSISRKIDQTTAAWEQETRKTRLREVAMTTFFRTVPPEEATGKLRELYDEDVRLHGRVRGSTEMLSLRPEVSAAWRSMDAALQSTMDPRHYELATLAASTSVSCSA